MLILSREVHAWSINSFLQLPLKGDVLISNTGDLGYDRLNGTRKIGPSYAKSVVYIWRILDMHQTGTKHIVRHMQKSVVQWSVISKFTCIYEKNFWGVEFFGISWVNESSHVINTAVTPYTFLSLIWYVAVPERLLYDTVNTARLFDLCIGSKYTQKNGQNTSIFETYWIVMQDLQLVLCLRMQKDQELFHSEHSKAIWPLHGIACTQKNGQNTFISETNWQVMRNL